VREVGGRLDAQGRELEPLDEGSVVTALLDLRDSGAESLVVCLMHSYRNPRMSGGLRSWLRSMCRNCLRPFL